MTNTKPYRYRVEQKLEADGTRQWRVVDNEGIPVCEPQDGLPDYEVIRGLLGKYAHTVNGTLTTIPHE